jgi:ABC-type sugar transport system permease subunit
MLTLTLCGLFGASGQVFLLTQGNWGTQTFSNWTYMQVYGASASPTSNSLNYLSAVGLCTTAVAVAIALTTRYVAGKVFEDVTY